MVADSENIKVIELFAGVGGFRLALDGHPDPSWGMEGAGPFETVWANQWEPPGTQGRQFAYRCYKERFDPEDERPDSISNEDIATVMDEVERGERVLPGCDMVVGGFPCQDYSVAKTLNQASGIEGKKGVLWWEILRVLDAQQPKYLLLENVDRLLKSPATQRGRDFAVMLSCLSERGYSVEWRVINAAEYGFPQQRRRVFIYGERTDETWSFEERVLKTGVIAAAFPVADGFDRAEHLELDGDLLKLSDGFGKGLKVSPFQNAGVMQARKVFTARVTPSFAGMQMTISDVLVDPSEVPEEFFIDETRLKDWEYLKAQKKEMRTSRSGHSYYYSEGSMSFPDPVDRPARTILTGEGGVSPSRFKHVIEMDDGRLRRLVPDELDQLQGFPKGWTDVGMTDGNRAFCMGNALVVGIPQRIGQEIARRHRSKK